MTESQARIFLAILVVLAAIAGASYAVANAQDPYQDDLWEVVVELRPGEDPTTVAPEIVSDVIREGTPSERINHLYTHAITGFSFFVTEDEYATLERKYPPGATSQILGISRSRQMSIPVVMVEGQTEFPATPVGAGSQITPTGVQRVDAGWAHGGGVDVAVLDTGVDASHGDLNVVGGVDCSTAPNTVPAWDNDVVGHGTHVAGIIAAKDNGEGVVGVAPDARIWSVKVLGDEGFGSTGSIICGLDWVVEHADVIDVANLSLGGQNAITSCGGPDPMHNATCAVTDLLPVVVAAGNSATSASSFSPANYAEVVTVAAYADFDGQPGGASLAPMDGCSALSRDDTLAAYSNTGDVVDIAAPGTCLLSTLPGLVDAGGRHYEGRYGYLSGTSMASPMVAGAIARYLALNPDQRYESAEQVIAWSTAHGDGVRDSFSGEVVYPLLHVGAGAPRAKE